MALFSKSFFSAEDKETLRKAIADADAMTSGEIRIFIERNCNGDPYHRAVHLLHKLELHSKAHRNAVLFYLAYEHKKFAVVGDEGIHAKVGDEFWKEIKDTCISSFSKGEYINGLIQGISMAGNKLKENFPSQPGNANQLRDDDVTINS